MLIPFDEAVFYAIVIFSFPTSSYLTFSACSIVTEAVFSLLVVLKQYSASHLVVLKKNSAWGFVGAEAGFSQGVHLC